MDKIITYSFCDNFIEKLADQIYAEFKVKGNDYSRLAIIFGGKRPSLFLKRALAKRVKTNFYPPTFFTIDRFVTHIIQQHEHYLPTKEFDSAYLIYNLVKDNVPKLLHKRKTFAEFLPWAMEILGFIDQIDLENISDQPLNNIEEIAKIGFSIPDEINQLLKQIVLVRNLYHDYLKENKIYSRGYEYLRASQLIQQTNFDKFEKIIFCNFFYFHRTEEIIVESLLKDDKSTYIFQGDQRKWPILDRLAKKHHWEIKEGEKVDTPQFDLKLYSAFDVHSEIGTVRKILEGSASHENTVVVLPNPDHIVPLISEISHQIKDFNISMGYPLKRSSLYNLLELIFEAQLSRKGEQYYTRDYLRVLLHPFVRSLQLNQSSTSMRTIIHKIEDILTGKERSAISGSLFLNLKKIEQLDELYILISEAFAAENVDISKEIVRENLEYVHKILFSQWENADNFSNFADVGEVFLNAIIEKSFLKNFPLNLNIAHKIYQLLEEFKRSVFKDEHFPKEEIFKVFTRKISSEIVAFIGSPLKGLQFLGLFETRSLNFENVIVLDVNEGTLPKLNIYEPLIPRDVMINLGLNRVELDEEIQRYQFMRLISSAKNVHLIYQQNREKEKSRFVEELIWEKQKQNQKMTGIDIYKPTYQVQSKPPLIEIKKTPEIIDVLRKHSFSASSINMYLRNPVDFYYQYVLGLRQQEDLLDEPEAREIGTFIHDILEEGFKSFLKKKPYLDEAFITKFNQHFDLRFDQVFKKSMKSDSFLLRSVVRERLSRFLTNERTSKERQVEEILYLETRFENVIPLSCGNIHFNYIIDRIDRMQDGTIMIIDYKTGSENTMPKNIDQIGSMDLSRENIFRHIPSFQIPLYFHFLLNEYKGVPINAALYNLRTLKIDPFIDQKTIHSYEQIDQIFMNALDFIVSEILDINVSFKNSQESVQAF
ncbi:MAG: PD-(D/E)XK nuclease family protein [Candidatus Omnitrophica bacterium]|nr:PD-(D/E)XK nuclease family protein [Candidatus Omnitrophota bacterium]